MFTGLSDLIACTSREISVDVSTSRGFVSVPVLATM